MQQFDTRFKQLDVLPLVKHFMDQLDLFNLFQKYVPATDNYLAEHAESLCVLIANIICDNQPLYKIKEWLSKYSDGLVDEPIQANLFNDDRLARALSALFRADRHGLMTEASCNAIGVHQLLTDEIHNDSTSITFLGKYKNADPEAVQLKLGHNKDFRADCKQIVFGLNITADGHIPNWNALRTLLEKEDFIYIADCKLCSSKNLAHIDKNNGRFITIVPKDRKEVKQFTDYLITNDVKWQDAYQVASSRKKDKVIKYKTYEADKTEAGYRIIWVHSSSKEEEDQKRRHNMIQKALKALEKLAPKLNQYHLKTKKEIAAAVDKICKGVAEFVDVKIVTQRKQIKVKVSPGRPSHKSVYKNKWKFTYRIQWEINAQAVNKASKCDGIFPLITNTVLQACEILKKYKEQPYLEKRMYTKKSILEVAPVFLKKEKRMEAMLFLYFLALMIVSLIERKIRMNMAKENIEKLPILPQAMNSKRPTWNNIRYFYRNIHLSEIIRDEVPVQTAVKGVSDLHQQINHLLEVPAPVYDDLKPGWWRFKHI